jgi:ribonuclease R
MQLDGMLVEGMLPADSLSGGPYQPDARETSLVGPQHTFTLGMPVQVRVVSTDEQHGRIELALVE